MREKNRNTWRQYCIGLVPTSTVLAVLMPWVSLLPGKEYGWKDLVQREEVRVKDLEDLVQRGYGFKNLVQE